MSISLRGADARDILRNFYKVEACHSAVTRLVILDEINVKLDQLAERFGELFTDAPVQPTGVRACPVLNVSNIRLMPDLFPRLANRGSPPHSRECHFGTAV